MRRRLRIALVVVALAVIAGLAACGGDEDRVVVPDVEGLTVEAGVGRVCGRFLEPAVTVDERAERAGSGLLIGSEPAAGSEVAVGSTVTLILPPTGDEPDLLTEPACPE